ncbi:MAG: hypothetical protein LBM23_06430 [Propionibacteriaceae bacterium]|jgi:hypothetical protein|nr:hypothetical protein [Propionibacteriaceae bacterium]
MNESPLEQTADPTADASPLLTETTSGDAAESTAPDAAGSTADPDSAPTVVDSTADAAVAPVETDDVAVDDSPSPTATDETSAKDESTIDDNEAVVEPSVANEDAPSDVPVSEATPAEPADVTDVTRAEALWFMASMAVPPGEPDEASDRFPLSDALKRVAKQVSDGRCGVGAATYLLTDEEIGTVHRVDLDDAATLRRRCAPALVPAGRWSAETDDEPSTPLTVGQQVAVNTVIGEWGPRRGAWSVTTPLDDPATTLALARDLVAAILVRWADVLTESDETPTPWGDDAERVLLWPTAAAEHGVVILTPEDATDEAIDSLVQAFDGLAQTIDAAPETAVKDEKTEEETTVEEDHVSPDDEAAVEVEKEVAAEEDHVFPHDEAEVEPAVEDEPGEEGATDPTFAERWAAAVAEYRAARADATAMAEERTRADDSFTVIRALSEGLEQLEREHVSADGVVALWERYAVEAEAPLAEATQIRDEAALAFERHRALKPAGLHGLLARAERQAWRQRSDELRTDLENKEEAVAAARARSAEVADNLATAQQWAEAAEVRFTPIHERVASARALYDDSEARWGEAVIDSAWWDDDAWAGQSRRQRRGFWLDEEWDSTRGACFQAARRLIATLGSGCATPVLVARPSAVAAVLPADSAECFGWLFLLDAGRMPPQDAAAAIWHARHTISFGDARASAPPRVILPAAEKLICDVHHVGQTWCPSRASVHSLLDRTTPFGVWVDGEPGWIGVPVA